MSPQSIFLKHVVTLLSFLLLCLFFRMSQTFVTSSVSSMLNEINRSNTADTEFIPFSPLFDAAIDNDHLSVQSLLSKNYDVNTKVNNALFEYCCCLFTCFISCTLGS